MRGVALKVRTVLALGMRNVARVLVYRLALRLGVHRVLRLEADVPEGPYFGPPASLRQDVTPRTEWRDQSFLFSKHRFPLPASGAPDWFADPFDTAKHAEAVKSWHQIGDFDAGVDDVKTVWELSRFDWLLVFAQRAATGDGASLDRLNHWLADWAVQNPPYRGVNWKCGQETSLRVLHLACAAHILGAVERPSQGLRDMLLLHLRRIAPTMSYAIGQSNNHGTSEAAALFIGGSWLGGVDGRRWAQTGRHWLEERAQSLVLEDGTFSQYSVNYHRILLDTYSFAAWWCARQALPAFSSMLTQRLTRATDWLAAITVAETGHAPNIGANDGARILALAPTDYLDVRPTLQFARGVFEHRRQIAEPGPWDAPAGWLNIKPQDTPRDAPLSRSFDKGGFHVLRQDLNLAVLRYPRFTYRPSQADALHLDFWRGAENLLCDAGTYSYAHDEGLRAGGTASHNTVAFDGRDQMPRLGRFLFGGWLKAQDVKTVQNDSAAAGYTDVWGAQHHREVVLSQGSLRVTDRLSGSASHAVLRWHLSERRDWQLTKNGARSDDVTVRVTGDQPLKFNLAEGWVARYYLHKTPVQVLEVETTPPAHLETLITF